MPIANYSTSVPMNQTLGEISGMLVQAGAQAVMTEYDGTRMPTSISFRLDRDGLPQPLHFRLPADWHAVQRVMRAQRLGRSQTEDEQCQRVAWRIIRDWLRAQLALIEAGCAKVEQVMLPYLLVGDEQKPLYEVFEARGFKALPAPKG